MTGNFFENRQVEVSGHTVELPIEYRDGSAVYFFFLVPTPRVASMLSGALEPAPLGFGKAVVAVCFYEYRDSSIGPYNELGIGVMGRPAGTGGWLGRDLLRPVADRRTGFSVLDLPVTTAAAESAGRQIWGLPKFIAKIPFALDGSRFNGAVCDPKSAASMFEVTADFTRSFGGRGLDLALLTERPGSLEKSVVTVSSGFESARCRSFSMKIGQSEHPMCHRLRQLELDRSKPSLVQYTRQFASKLYGPVALHSQS